MKFDFLSKIDLSGMDEASVKSLQTIQDAMNSAVEEFMGDAIGKKAFEEKLEEITKKMDSGKELEAVRKELEEMKEVIVRMKGAMMRNEEGGMEIKSVERQIEEQLKDFITVGKHGEKTVDLRTACKQSVGFKKNLTIVLNAKAATPVTSANVAPHYSMTVDNELSVEPRSQTVIRNFANVASISTRSLTYAEFNPGDGDAEWVPEGGVKPMMGGTLAEVTITAGKVALGAKVTEETLSDLPQLVAEVKAEIINRIGLKEEEGILSGTGTGGQIKGVAADMPAFSLTTLKVDKPNTYDVIVAMYTQVISMSNMAYRPNLVLMNPLDYAQMQLTKDANGQYLRPFHVGDELIQGLRVETSTAIKQGDVWVGDFNYLNIRDVWVLTVTLGWENDDFTKNMVTILGEKRLMAYIKKQYRTAFVKDKIATVKEAITVAQAGA